MTGLVLAFVLAFLTDDEFEAAGPPLPEHLAKMWQRGELAYEEFRAEFHKTGAVSNEAKRRLQEAAEELTALSRYTLGSAREFMLYGRLQDVYAPLARDDAFCSDAASWCIQRAVHASGSDSYASLPSTNAPTPSTSHALTPPAGPTIAPLA